MMMKMIIWKSNVNGSCHNIPTAIKYLFNKSGASWVEVIAKMPQKSVVSSDISQLKTFKYKIHFLCLCILPIKTTQPLKGHISQHALSSLTK